MSKEVFTNDDLQSSLWRRLKAQMEFEIEDARHALETSPDHSKVLRLQGRIAALRDFMRKVDTSVETKKRSSIFPEYSKDNRHGSLY